MSEPDERQRRWRLILGGGDADGTGCSLQGNDQGMDRALQALYDSDDRRGGGWAVLRPTLPAGSVISAATFHPQSCV